MPPPFCAQTAVAARSAAKGVPSASIHRELPGQRHLGLAHPRTEGQPGRPAFQSRALHRLRQDDVRGLVQGGTHAGVPDLGNASGHVGLPGLVLPRRQGRNARPPPSRSGTARDRPRPRRRSAPRSRPPPVWSSAAVPARPPVPGRAGASPARAAALRAPRGQPGGPRRWRRGSGGSPPAHGSEPGNAATWSVPPSGRSQAPQHPAQAHLHVEVLRLQQLARGQQRPRLLRRHRLTVHGPEPAQPH
jgi:hypothetical protein